MLGVRGLGLSVGGGDKDSDRVSSRRKAGLGDLVTSDTTGVHLQHERGVKLYCTELCQRRGA